MWFWEGYERAVVCPGWCEPSSNESTSQYGIRISTVVEEGQVDYMPVSAPSCKVPGPNRIRSTQVKEERKISRSPVKMPQRFENADLPITLKKRFLFEDPAFAFAMKTQSSRRKSRWSGQDRRASTVFQGVSVFSKFFFFALCKAAFHFPLICNLFY